MFQLFGLRYWSRLNQTSCGACSGAATLCPHPLYAGRCSSDATAQLTVSKHWREK